jgi:HEAT repeat protein
MSIHKSQPSFLARFSVWTITAAFVVGIGGAVVFFVSDEVLLKKLDEQGALAVPAAYVLGLHGCKEPARKPLWKTLDSNKAPEGLRVACAWSLGHAHSRDVVPWLRSAACDEPKIQIRLAAVKALGENKDFLASDTLSRLIDNDSEGPVRGAACAAAGELGDISLVPVLIPKLHEGTFGIRETAHKALLQLTGQSFPMENEAAWQSWWDKTHGR